MEEFGYTASHVLPHGSYLINLGNPDKRVFTIEFCSELILISTIFREKREKAYNCFLDDLLRCEQLGLLFYNFQYALSMIFQFEVNDIRF
jgi:AP endonuclease-1